MGSGGTFRTPAVPYMIFTDASQSFALTEGTVTLDGVTIGLTTDFRYFVVPLDPADDHVSLTGNQLKLTADHLNGSVTVDIRTVDGKQSLYPS